MSNHFKRSLQLLGMIVLLLSGLYLWVLHRIHRRDIPPAASVLPHNVKEVITVDSNRNTITIKTPTGTVVKHIKHGDVVIGTDNKVTVKVKQFGLEFEPFIGYGYSDTFRLYVGSNWAYVYRFDLFSSLGVRTSGGPAFVQVISGIGYNVWRNTSLNVGVDTFSLLPGHEIHPAAFVSIKF